jgi:HK97 family phage portal protein
LQSDVLHIKDRSDNGLIGVSRLSRAAATFRTAIELQTFSESLYRNGTAPSGAVKHEAKLSAEAVATLRQRFETAHQGSQKAGKVLILDQGLTWQPMSISPEDAELLASRRFSVEELARIYSTPPPLCGDFSHSSFTNSETASKWFSMFCLTPIVRKIESEFRRSALEERVSLEIDLSGFQRGDYATRWQAHAIAVSNGILTVNEVREVEGFDNSRGGRV